MTSILVCHPLDTIRVRLQTSERTRFQNAGKLISQTIATEGVTAFYKGLSVPLLTQGIQKAVMFTTFGACQRTLNQSTAADPVIRSLLSGAVAGFANCFVASPIELIRSRLQVQYHTKLDQAEYRGPWDVVKKTIKTGGIRALFTGLAPMVYRDVPGVACWYGTFEWAKRRFQASNGPAPMAAWQLIAAGSMAGIGYWALAFPQDTIKSVIQTGRVDGSASGFFSTARSLIARDGFGRLWRGFPIALVRGIPGASVTFYTFTIVQQYINRQREV